MGHEEGLETLGNGGNRSGRTRCRRSAECLRSSRLQYVQNESQDWTPWTEERGETNLCEVFLLLLDECTFTFDTQ